MILSPCPPFRGQGMKYTFCIVLIGFTQLPGKLVFENFKRTSFLL